MTNPSVFISYSHDTIEHENRVLELSDRLREDGIDANIDQYQVVPPEGWQLWMEKQIRDSQFVVLVCTETYLNRVMKEDGGKGLGVMWESTIIYQYLYDAGVVNKRFIPIVFGRDNTKHIPTTLKPTNFYDVSTEEGYEALYRRITAQPYTIKPKLGVVRKLAPRERRNVASRVEVALAKLPSTSPDLFGREEKLKQLEDAWNQQDINILSLVAWGGVGKSALVNKWLSQMARDNYRGAERVYGWSFYSQGATEGRQVSADQFIAAALEWFGDPDSTKGSPWDKGERLAGLIKGKRTLLILDGLEPLQNPPPVETGKIKDPGLTSLLRELARQNPGLVVISTRLTVDDLKDFIGSTAMEIDLETLSNEAGAEYLKYLGVDGTDDERKDASRDFGGHALALTLLGRYLKVVHGGDIRKRKEIPRVMDEQKQGKHARRVMASYEVFLKSKPELDILRLMGLFDRPAKKDAIDALRKEPVIVGLTDALQRLNDASWQFAVANLRDLRVIAVSNTNDPDELDCHPLLREHFGEQLKEDNLAAWLEGNNRLYEYYKASTKEFPDAIQEMAPLFTAVIHGCQAGRHQEAFLDVYWKRITRRGEFFSTNKLGLHGADLASLSGFFDDTSWHKLVDGLREDLRGLILNQAGINLRSLGRLMEFGRVVSDEFDTDIETESWENATRVTINISDTYNILGALTDAVMYAKQSVEFSNRSGDAYHQRGARATLGYALHQAGHFSEAEFFFREAEEIQKVKQPNVPILFSGEGFEYCDLLLSQGNYAEVERRVAKYFKWRHSGDSLLDIAHEYLSLGRAYLFNPQRKSKHSFTESLAYLNRAVDGLRQSGILHELPRGLLSRAEYYRLTGDLKKAQKDLDEAFSIVTRGGMGLFLADCYLEYARLHIETFKGSNVQTDILEARQHLSKAEEMINKMGYHRRDKEVEELEEKLK